MKGQKEKEGEGGREGKGGWGGGKEGKKEGRVWKTDAMGQSVSAESFQMVVNKK